MAVTYGFYNALNHDRLYDAIQMSSIFDGIIRDGIFSTIGDTMIVTAPEDGLYVNVGSGRAWFNHTWTLNDTDYPIEAEQAEVVLDRIDAVILEVNSSAEVRANSIKFLKGTPSSNPVKPTLTHNAEVNQYALAYVRIKAGQTTIFQSDIENAVGTDETPFITGVLQQVSIETLLKQWEAEFNTYFTNFKNTSTTEFNNWFAAKVSEYTAWFAQMQTDMDSNFNEFDAWFQRMKDQLDQDQAGHLQLQIDALEEEMPFIGGSKVNINFEYDVIPNIQYSNEHYKLTVGDTVRENNFSSSNLHFDEYGILTVGDGILEVTYDITDSRTGKVTHASYTYTINMPYFGRFIYNVTISASLYDYQGWLESIGKDPSKYSTIEDVFADEKLLRELMTRHASVDYLVEWLADNNEDAHTVLNNDYCAKWINLRDYALDKLYANPTVKAVMDEVDKYGYGEWALVGQVPKMTSNTAPYGECSGSSVYSGRDYYYAFNEDTDEWLSNSSSVGQYLQYTFTKPIRISGFKIKHRAYLFTSAISFKIQGYNGANWEDISEEFNIPSMDNTTHTFDGKVNATKDYQSYRVYYTSSIFSSDNSFYQVDLLQFYAWQPKGNVPVMTSNTAPYGEASASSVYQNTYHAYRAFDGESMTDAGWVATGNTDCWIQYKFANPIKVNRVSLMPRNSSGNSGINNFKVQGSNDGNIFEDIYTGQCNGTIDSYQTFTFNNDDYYLYYRIHIVDIYSGATYCGIQALQFYGRELKVSVPKMTSDTAPWGEATSGGVSLLRPAYYAFDNDSSTSVARSVIGELLPIEYNFNKKVRVQIAFMNAVYDGYKGELQYSDNGTNWISCSDNKSTEANKNVMLVSTENYAHKYWRIYFTCPDSQFSITAIQFYGLDYSEREFAEGSTMKYLYDHGIKFEELTLSDTSYESSEEIIVKGSGNVNTKYVSTSQKINLTQYSIERMVSPQNDGGILTIGANSNLPPSGNWEAYRDSTTDDLPYNSYLDITSINEERYLQLGSGGRDTHMFSVTEWWLE